MPWAAIGAFAASAIGGGLKDKENKRIAERGREFSISSSGSAHQRQVADLRAAGLNPILSGMGGSGAATSASGLAADAQDNITPALNSALAVDRQEAEVNNMTETNKQIKAQTDKAVAETALTKATTAITTAQLPKHQSQAQFWIQALRALKGINEKIINPLIKKLESPATASSFQNAIKEAEILYYKAKEKLTPTNTIKNPKRKPSTQIPDEGQSDLILN